MDDFNMIKNEFYKLHLEPSSEPYKYICENYQDYIFFLKKHKNEDNIKEANEAVINKLNYGFGMCCVWDDDTINKHICEVYNLMESLSDILNKGINANSDHHSN